MTSTWSSKNGKKIIDSLRDSNSILTECIDCQSIYDLNAVDLPVASKNLLKCLSHDISGSIVCNLGMQDLILFESIFLWNGLVVYFSF